MTLKEKALLLSGKGMWKTYDFEAYGIPAFFLSDGPHGMRTQEGQGDWLGINKSKAATCFPTVPTCVRLKWNWRRRSTPPMRLVPPSIPILPSRGLLDGLITACLPLYG